MPHLSGGIFGFFFLQKNKMGMLVSVGEEFLNIGYVVRYAILA